MAGRLAKNSTARRQKINPDVPLIYQSPVDFGIYEIELPAMRGMSRAMILYLEGINQNKFQKQIKWQFTQKPAGQKLKNI